ncbi:UNVERIFIED_ORG: hypothetical protein FHR35_006767 [Microbispora rosea subsp. rosea]
MKPAQEIAQGTRQTRGLPDRVKVQRTAGQLTVREDARLLIHENRLRHRQRRQLAHGGKQRRLSPHRFGAQSRITVESRLLAERGIAMESRVLLERQVLAESRVAAEK